ncbi:MAG: hypothetical protein J6P19_04570 [Acetobacter sp.]|nr:hypothetical protein [Acetobacter sp.]
MCFNDFDFTELDSFDFKGLDELDLKDLDDFDLSDLDSFDFSELDNMDISIDGHEFDEILEDLAKSLPCFDDLQAPDFDDLL